MKKSFEYLKELFEEPYNLTEGSIDRDFLKTIKQIQIDAIEETVKLCAEKIKLEKAYDYGTFNEEYAKFKEYTEDVFIEDTRGFGECGYVAIRPSKQSILNCAEILKKDL